MKQRILGFDLARGLAIIGMVFVNFKVVMATEGTSFLYQALDLLTGKAAALFIVLAGIGMTLMYEGAKRKNNSAQMWQVKVTLLKRAAFLLLVGLSYYVVWPADILHYYGVFIFIGVWLLAASRVWLQAVSILLIIGYPVLLGFFDYETGWDFSTLSYTDFFTVQGFFRNLFFNGFHPVIPWLAFLLTGMWVGRIDLNNVRRRNRVMIISLAVFIVFKSLSVFLVFLTTKLIPNEAEELCYLLGTEPMPPLFFYMVTAGSLAIFIISASVSITPKYSNALFIKQMISTGQLALSNYFFHVMIGMFGIALFYDEIESAFSIEFVFFYALIFNVILIVFSHLWRRKYKRGPIEQLMRKITG